MPTDPSISTVELAYLLIEALEALRATGRIVQGLADEPGMYRVDGSPPISSRAVVVLAWELGLMSSDAGNQ